MYIISDEVVSNCFTNVCSVFVTIFYVLYTSEQSNRNTKPVFASSCFFPPAAADCFALQLRIYTTLSLTDSLGLRQSCLLWFYSPIHLQHREHVLFFMRSVFRKDCRLKLRSCCCLPANANAPHQRAAISFLKIPYPDINNVQE